MSVLESVLLVLVVFLVLFVWCQSIRMDTLERRLEGAHSRITEASGTAWLAYCKVEHWQADAGGFVRLSREHDTTLPRETQHDTTLKETLLNETIDALVDAAQKLEKRQ